MPKNDNPLQLQGSLNPWIALLSLSLFVVGGVFTIGPLLALVLLFPLGITDLTMLLTPDPDNPMARTALLIYQGSISVSAFIIAPALFIKYVERIQPVSFLRAGSPLTLPMVLSVFLMVLAFMFVNSLVIEWNMGLKLPDFLSGLEQWFRSMEDQMEELTLLMIKADNLGSFLFGLLIIAVIPAIGEEFLFRGLIQNYLLKISGKHHLAIWITAIIFGSIHLQFYGVFPRILLGALFGYLYFWSGSLWVAILAHFANNGITLYLSYLYQNGNLDFDVTSPQQPPVYIIIFAGIAFIALLVYFKRSVSKLNT